MLYACMHASGSGFVAATQHALPTRLLKLPTRAGTVVPSCEPFQPPPSSSKHGWPGGSTPPLGGPKFFCVRSRTTPGAWCRWSLKRFGIVCRAPVSPCDTVEFCPGGSPECPPDRQASPGTPCQTKGNVSLATAELVCLVPGARSQSRDIVAATAVTCSKAASEEDGAAAAAAVTGKGGGGTFACGRCSVKGRCIDEGRWRCRKPL